jgi:hypothetical protein
VPNGVSQRNLRRVRYGLSKGLLAYTMEQTIASNEVLQITNIRKFLKKKKKKKKKNSKVLGL